MEHLARDEMSIPRQEIDRRIANVRRRMAGRGLEALIVFASPGSLRFGQRGHVLYLSGYEPYFGDCMMILPLDDTIDAVLVKDAADHFPQTCTWIADVREAGDRVKVVGEFLPTMTRNGPWSVAGVSIPSAPPSPAPLEEVDLRGRDRLPGTSRRTSGRGNRRSTGGLEDGGRDRGQRPRGCGALHAARRHRIGRQGRDGASLQGARLAGLPALHHGRVGLRRDAHLLLVAVRTPVLEAGDPLSRSTSAPRVPWVLLRPVAPVRPRQRASARQRDVLKVLVEAHHAAAAARKTGCPRIRGRGSSQQDPDGRMGRPRLVVSGARGRPGSVRMAVHRLPPDRGRHVA